MRATLKFLLLATALLTTPLLAESTPKLQATLPPAEEELRAVATTMLAKGLEDSTLDQVRVFAADTQAKPYLRSRAMAAYALGLLLRGHHSRFEQVQNAHRKSYPTDHSLIPDTINEQVQGYKNGTIQQLPMPAAIAALKNTLNDIIDFFAFNDQMHANIATAQSETNLARRIELCHELLAAIKIDEQRTTVEQMLKEALAAQRQQAEAERLAREATAAELRKLQELEQSPEPLVALRSLQDYLADNPDTPHRYEARRILNVLTVAVEKKRQRQRLWYWLGGALIALLIIKSVSISLYKYTIYSHHKTIPIEDRITKIDIDKLTDPHTINKEHGEPHS